MKQKKGNLYLIPTPLAANSLDQIQTPALINLLPSLKYFLVEHLRTARRFISSLQLGINIESLQFEQLDKNTPDTEAHRICSPLLQGESIGLMSEAGCPGVADPGNLAVQFAHDHGIRVIPLVGPSSILLALMASGMNGQSFAFHGYLPIDKQKRIKSIKSLEKESLLKGQTQIFIETPYRNNQMFADLIKHCQPDMLLCVARDVTGADEMIYTRSIRDWRKNKPELHKIPVIFLLYGA